jgi:YebC/PmpR family DNA-binding regulatory protein
VAGHSKWANIRHRKGAQDAKRGKIFTKLVKEIVVAVKTGGGPDPDFNPRLRTAVTNARGQSMPKDNIERAIKKASGVGGAEYQESTFEGYGPEGIAIFVECATDNNTRTVANIRMHFKKNGGSLGKDGCLQFIFDHKGVFTLKNEGFDPDELMLDVVDAGAEDFVIEDDSVIIYTEMTDFGSVQKKLQELSLEPLEAGLQRISNMSKELSESSIAQFLKLIDTLEDDDDVQKVYHNAEISEELLEKYL